MAVQIPVNYVSTVGVSVRAACFADGVYEYEQALKCLSNLFAAGFSRIVFDVYWDARRRAWSLCPVQLPLSTGAIQTLPSGTASSQLQNRNEPRDALLPEAQRRQASTTATTGSPTSPASSTYSVSSSATLVSLPSQLPIAEELFQLGQYNCGSLVDLPLLTGFLNSYLRATDNTLQALVKLVILNVHSAALYEAPDEPAQEPSADELPSAADELGSIFLANLTSYLYTSDLLSSQRANLQVSWLNALQSIKPDPAYYTVSTNGTVQYTTDGWPSISWLEVRNSRRLLVGYGTVDPQMSNYDTTKDNHVFFDRPGYHLGRNINTSMSSSGSVTDGCIFDSSNTSLSASNNSWATTEDTSSLHTYQRVGSGKSENIDPTPVTNMIECGLSPVLNQSLLNTTANVNYTPYLEYLGGEIWSWANGQPKNDSQQQNSDNADSAFRCATFNAFSNPPGRWQTTTCESSYHAACRNDHEPHVWSFSSDQHNYLDSAEGSCPSNSSFAVPRTALENRYLLQAYHDFKLTSQNDALIWIDFNSLDKENCWVQGANSTCPYHPEHEDTRDILVVTIGSIVVIALAVAVLIVKCGANRLESKRQRRVLDGWEYEGVPS